MDELFAISGPDDIPVVKEALYDMFVCLGQEALNPYPPKSISYVLIAAEAMMQAHLFADTPCSFKALERFFLDKTFRRLIIAFCQSPASKELYDREMGPLELLPEKMAKEWTDMFVSITRLLARA